MSDMSHLIPEGATAESIFMPEGQCARCAEEQPIMWETFQTCTTSLPDKLTKLGFCCQECYAAFVGGIEGARSMRIET